MKRMQIKKLVRVQAIEVDGVVWEQDSSGGGFRAGDDWALYQSSNETWSLVSEDYSVRGAASPEEALDKAVELARKILSLKNRKQ